MEEEKMADKIRVLLGEEEVNKRINEVAEQINKDYAGKDIHLICILKGGVFFTCELAKRLTIPVSMDFMSVSSYGAGTVSSGVVKIIKDLDEPLEGKDVLIVEDIIDSGRTLAYLIEILKQRGPKSIHLCTLLDKPERRVKKQVHVDYTCFTIPDEFVVGYGLDYDQKYRNLPYIGIATCSGARIRRQQQSETTTTDYDQWLWSDHGGVSDLFPGDQSYWTGDRRYLNQTGVHGGSGCWKCHISYCKTE